MKKSSSILAFSVALICCCIGATIITSNILNRNGQDSPQRDYGSAYTTLAPSAGASAQSQPIDLTEAAEKTVHGVVHIKSTVKSRTQTYQEPQDIFDYMFGARPRQRQYRSEPQVGYGSTWQMSSNCYSASANSSPLSLSGPRNGTP